MKSESFAGLHAQFREGTVDPLDLILKEQERADRWDGDVGAFIHRQADVLQAAAAVNCRLHSGLPMRPMDGVTVGVKDVVLAGVAPTTGQSVAYLSGWESDRTRESTVIRRLRQAGAIVVGTTSTMELAYGLAEEGKPFPVPRNPHNLDFFPGGSSSGSAIGVATGFFQVGIGTDTGGSIRIPAAMCGVTGLKPTFGSVPRDGVMPLAPTLDHVGPIAASAARCREVFEVIANPVALERCRRFLNAGKEGLMGVRIGVDRLDQEVDLVDPNQPLVFEEALRTLSELGADIIDVTLPQYRAASAAALLSLVSEASGQWGDLLIQHAPDLNQATRILLDAGKRVPRTDYLAAQRVRAKTRIQLQELFKKVDAIITPTSHLDAPRMDTLSTLSPMSFLPSVHTGYWSGVGLPSVAVPIGQSTKGLPLSMLVNAARHGDLRALAIAEAFQQVTEHHLTLATPPTPAEGGNVEASGATL